MIKEPKNIDFYTTGRQPSNEEFVRVSEWIKNDKQKRSNKNESIKSAKKQLAKLS